MLVDSHCHLNFADLADNLPAVLQAMHDHGVEYALCVGVTLKEFPQVLAIAEGHEHIFASVGIHPDYEDEVEAGVEDLVRLATHPKVIAIGETGLDYFRLQGDLEWQRARFRVHIRAAIAAGKPLIIHTRNAAEDTLRIMREEGAERVGGVMHCFTESWEVAEQAMALGFYISFSGIVTFKNASLLKDVARRMPLDRMLVETDSPYLAPIPYRGKINQPAYVRYVAQSVADLRGMPLEDLADATTRNFFQLFQQAKQCM
ncbi:putative deoxyribonuclease YcfH [mine drainage metagenome]|uniref:Putative deoxyribonuclease YcfH n=1 Tax=mine drainage metagenome TaxID=410659 RepID=A0A1J5R2D3_9ZZZZ